MLVTQRGDPLARKEEKRNALTVRELSHIFEEVHIGLALKRRSQQEKRS